MGIEELLPGLLKVTEQKFGKRVGGALATVFLLLILLGGGAFFLKLFVDNAIAPLVGFTDIDFANLNVADFANTMLVFLPGAVVYAAIVVSVNWGLRAWSWRKLRAERLHNRRMAREYKRALYRITADLRTQGVVIVEKQLEEEHRMLTAIITEDAKYE